MDLKKKMKFIGIMWVKPQGGKANKLTSIKDRGEFSK